MINNDVTIKEKCLAINIDIRNSTNFHKNYEIDEAASIVSNFMSDCYVEMTRLNNKFFSNIIYAGDGIIGICYADDNNQAFNELFEIASNIKKVIFNYKEYFNVGIGIDCGETAIIKVKNVRQDKNNTLYTGNSVSTAAKLCKAMPFKHKYQNKKSYIAISKKFYQELSQQNQNKFIKTKTKFIELV